MARLDGFSANVQTLGTSTDWADHTWVRADLNGNGDYRYFDCWGNHSGPNTRMIVCGNGSYKWANCYRCPIGPFPDTAGIGIYAIDGVCHQSANCFLYTAGVTLNFNVRGYWFSLLSYGTYGRAFLRWLLSPYGWCSWTTPYSITAAGGQNEMADNPEEKQNPTIEIVRRVYGAATAGGPPKHPHELLADEAAEITKLHIPEIDPDTFRDVHLNYLRQKEDLIAAGHKGEHLAKQLDELERKTQKELAKRLGRELYERLMGVPPGQELGLVEPDLAGAVGLPMPPQEVLLKGTPLDKKDSSKK